MGNGFSGFLFCFVQYEDIQRRIGKIYVLGWNENGGTESQMGCGFSSKNVVMGCEFSSLLCSCKMDSRNFRRGGIKLLQIFENIMCWGGIRTMIRWGC